MKLSEQTLQKKFEEKKKEFYYVPLNKCRFSKDVPTASISMKTFEISVNPDFIERTAETGKITPEKALDAILEHEIGHFAYHPFSAERVIAEVINAKGFQNGESVRQLYDDINNNLRLVARNPSSNIPLLYRATSPESDLEKVILKFYERQTEQEFGAGEISHELEPYVFSLEKINFLNATPQGRIEFVKLSEGANLSDMGKFYHALKPLFEKQEGQPQTNNPTSPSPDDFDEKNLRKGLKKLIQGGTISREDVKKFIDDHGHNFESGSLPGGAYNNNPESFADRFFYESLAQKYKIRIKKAPIVSSDGAYPTSLDKLSFSDSLEDFDPFSSMGTRILPGVSNKWIREQIKSHGQFEKTPDLCLLLDDSGSMPDPREETSNAVISSLAISREYIKNQASVAVILFSDRTISFEGSKDYNLVAEHLRTYKNGDDTRIDLKKVPKKDGADYVVITDGEIKNRDEAIGFLNEHANRAYFITINEDKPHSVEGRVKHMYVHHAEDIGKIVLDDIHRKGKQT